MPGKIDDYLAEKNEQRLTVSPVDLIALSDRVGQSNHVALCLDTLATNILESIGKENGCYRLIELLCMDLGKLADDLSDLCCDIDDLRDGLGGSLAE